MGKGLPRSMSRGAAARQEVIKQEINLNKVVPVFAAAAGVGFGTVVVGDFPEGNIYFISAMAYLTLAGASADANVTATWDGDFSIGTTPTADATLDTTDVNIIPSTSTGPATAKISPRVRAVGSSPAYFDNTDGSLELNLNVLIDAANITDATTVNLTASGTLQLVYIVMLDD